LDRAGSTLQLADGFPHERNGAREILHNDAGFNAKDFTAKTPEIPIPARIGCDTLPMLDAIHLHDEANGGSEEICDGISQDHLPAETDAELSTGELPPERGLRSGGRVPMRRRARSEDVLASGSERVKGLEHGVLLAPGACPSAAPLGASDVTREESKASTHAERGAAVAPPAKLGHVPGARRTVREWIHSDGSDPASAACGLVVGYVRCRS
jgi:hypothetical protein